MVLNDLWGARSWRVPYSNQSICPSVNFNLGYNFWLVSARAFIFHMCIPSGKAFHLIPWLWPFDLNVWPSFWRQTHVLWMLCFIEIFDQSKKQCQFWNLWWGPFWLGQSYSTCINLSFDEPYHSIDCPSCPSFCLSVHPLVWVLNKICEFECKVVTKS
jgi:hypothetical protein